MSFKKTIPLWCSVVIWMGVLSGCGSERVSLTEQRINQERAQPYIVALAQYQAVHGSFPPTLDGLHPTMDAIPLTTHGEPFTYHIERTTEYLLCFGNESYRGCCYHHYLELWDCTGQAKE